MKKGGPGLSNEDGPPVDVLVVPPTGERRFAYVSTFGCAFSSLPAEPYKDEGVDRRVEFVLAAQQRGDDDECLRSLNLAANTVRQFAKLVHLNGVTVEPGETVAFSPDPQPVYDDAPFCAFAFLKPRLPGPGFENLNLSATQIGEPVRYMAPVPIHRDELDYGVEHGPKALETLLNGAGVTEMVDLERSSALPLPEAQPVQSGWASRHGFSSPPSAPAPSSDAMPGASSAQVDAVASSPHAGAEPHKPAMRMTHFVAAQDEQGEQEARAQRERKRQVIRRILAMFGLR